MGAVTWLQRIELYRFLCSLFGRELQIRYHDLSAWYGDEARGVYKRLWRALRRFRFYRQNRFFLSAMVDTLFFVHMLRAELISLLVVRLLKKHKRHWLVIRFLRRVVRFYYAKYKVLSGLKIKVSGKINGRRRKKKRVVLFGSLPLQTFEKDVDYSYRIAVTKFGVFGVKVWAVISRPNDEFDDPEWVA